MTRANSHVTTETGLEKIEALPHHLQKFVICRCC